MRIDRLCWEFNRDCKLTNVVDKVNEIIDCIWMNKYEIREYVKDFFKDVEMCKRCVQPVTRPKVYFNEEGICGACLWEEQKKGINWEEREKELSGIVKWAKKEASKRGSYDCVIGVSGGKDSTFTALYARDRLGLNCLLVNAAPAQQTRIGQHNIDNLFSLGFDVVTLKVNPIFLRKLIRKDFYEHLNTSKPTEYPLWASSYQMALGYNIPLVIQGENAALTLGVRKDGSSLDGNAIMGGSINTRSGGNAFEVYGGYDGIDEKDLLLYKFPSIELLKKADVHAIWLQYYAREWSQYGNARVAIMNGMHVRDDTLSNLGRIHKWSCLDNDFHMVNQFFKFVKLGFGFATDEVCYDIREGLLTREQGLELVEKYDGLVGDEYIKCFCDYVGIGFDEFFKVVMKWLPKKKQ